MNIATSELLIKEALSFEGKARPCRHLQRSCESVDRLEPILEELRVRDFETEFTLALGSCLYFLISS